MPDVLLWSDSRKCRLMVQGHSLSAEKKMNRRYLLMTKGFPQNISATH